MKKTELLQIRVTPSLKNKLKLLAKEEGTTMSSLVSNLLDFATDKEQEYDKNIESLHIMLKDMSETIKTMGKDINELEEAVGNKTSK